MKTSLLLTTLLVGAPTLAAAQTQPNILFILTDDVGAEAFGCYGGKSYLTPNIDALAAGGIRYAHAYSTPLCTPSRVQLLTGRYGFRNYETFGWLNPEETTVAEVLLGSGYNTAIAGKWQLSNPQNKSVAAGKPQAPKITPDILRDAYGFDQYHLWQLNFPGTTSRYWKPVIEQNGAIVKTTDADYGPDLDVKFLNAFMAESVAEGKPFLAYYAMALPHDPWVVTPDSTSGRSKTENDTANFADNVAYTDKLVGKLVEQIDALGIRDNTLIIFTSDNGTRWNLTSQTGNGAVQGDKGNGTEAGTHVPFILNWSGHIDAGVSERPVDFCDLFPTLMAVSGTSQPSDLILDGKALVGADGADGEDRPAAYLWYDNHGERRFPPAEWAHNGRFKLYSDGRLFDVSDDPLEQAEIAPGNESPEAETARDELQKTLNFYAAEQGKS